ncbi:hypothetical protein [Streptomyces sp. 8N706]|uniref:hypothetical protein n=1 Tax=Streptomyces sp. 8N706 TaxID=3457416 RepID=UPI003FD047DF
MGRSARHLPSPHACPVRAASVPGRARAVLFPVGREQTVDHTLDPGTSTARTRIRTLIASGPGTTPHGPDIPAPSRTRARPPARSRQPAAG